MPKLILFNGPPACGKSTLARRYADDHPLTLDLDIDEVCAMLGGWREDRRNAGTLARGIALAAARTHLASGHDVVVPQLLARPEFIEALESLAHEAGATFHEIALLDSRANMLRRFADRVDHPRGDTGDAELLALYDRLMALLPSRPDARIVPVEDGKPDETYQAVLHALR
ncbi:MAG TPA: AAA family ATPase [Pseudonocardiaceae bacterium]|jgi:predicted kinase|nr:AAA family ATPase [Pseudonocardiaceae bacterium]